MTSKSVGLLEPEVEHRRYCDVPQQLVARTGPVTYALTFNIEH